MPDLEIALLRSFVTVSRSGSMRAAALRIGRTQSAVSLQIQRLEDLVGEELFHRTGSGVALTVAGERFFPGAQRVLAAHDETLASIRQDGLSGSIVFGCPEDYLTAFFPDLLRRFGAAHPGIEIEVISAPTVELWPLLQRRRIDLALVSQPGTAGQLDVIRHEPLVWIASTDAPTLLEESTLPIALSAPGSIDHIEARRALDASSRTYRVAHASNGLAGLLAIARSGLAISVATRAAVPGDLSIVTTGLPPLPEIGISLAYASVRLSPTIRSFGSFVALNLT